MNETSLDRIERERQFHNDRFTHEVRDAQGKYYASIKDGLTEFDRRVLAESRGLDVLEYGCGCVIQGLGIARVAKSLSGIDISDVAVAEAQSAANAENIKNVKYQTMNAEDLTYPDGSFDLVFGRGILHHLDLDLAYSNIARVLRPGGKALFWEPLGHNPVLNRYRSATPEARTDDEHPLVKKDFQLAEKYFKLSELQFFGLTTILSVPVRDTPLGDNILAVTRLFDRLIFRTPARWMAWHVLMEMRKV